MADPPQRGDSAHVASSGQAEPFPELSVPSTPQSPTQQNTDGENERPSEGRGRTGSLIQSVRRASKVFEESNPPTGMWIATGQIASSLPSLSDIRRGSFGSDGWSTEGQVREKLRRASRSNSQVDVPLRKTSAGANPEALPIASGDQQTPPLVEVPEEDNRHSMANGSRSLSAAGVQLGKSSSPSSVPTEVAMDEGYRTEPFDNGYQFPPKRSWQESTAIFFKASWKFVTTPIGFAVTIYGLNVVAWGGMLFLLLCNASKYMCVPTCNDINSPRRVWIEIDSQILNALFCVTGFGTIPWRFRDLYYLLQFRIKKNELGLRRLAGINRGWFRLPGSQELPVAIGPHEAETQVGVPNSSIAYPASKTPDAPLTGVRAPPTAMWKLDFVIWCMVWNTFLQAVLSGFMWGMNRYDRPSWSTGLFVALACIVAGVGGIMSFVESKKVKAIEGVPLSDADREKLKRDKELGIVHYNNIKDEAPKELKHNKTHGQKSEKCPTEDTAKSNI